MVNLVNPKSGRAEIHETHAGVVLLLGDKAIKVKKPVKFEFLDFSTPEKRLHALERELSLNRRLAPEVYEGVYTVCDDRGRAVEYALVMKRMPGDRSLERLAQSGACVDDCLVSVARKVGAFHRNCADSRISPAIAAEGEPRAILARWEENFKDIRRFVPEMLREDVVRSTEESARRYVAGRHRLLRRRIESGEIKDGHGDLLAADIFCLDSEPEILDCIEFDDRYRYCDVASETAFLAMDLIRLGRPGDARRFLVEYVRSYGRPLPYTLLEFYVAYRAGVRAKVACLGYEQGHRGSADAAVQLAQIAEEHAARSVPLLVLVGGAPGSGKSSLARALQQADSFAQEVSGEPRFALLRSDVIRKELAGMKPEERSGSPLGGGIYTSEFTGKTYDEMLRRAGDHLAMGLSVVMDATFADAALRKAAADTAEAHDAGLVELRCEAPAEIREARIRERTATAADPSEADEYVARAIAARFDDWPTAVRVDTSGSHDASLHFAVGAIERITRTRFSWP